MKRLFLALLAGVALFMALPVADAQSAPTDKLYELRIYTANPGKLSELQAVMASQGARLFSKHGIQNIFDATVVEGAPIDGTDAGNMLVCILAHNNCQAADKSWAAFDADAVWQKAWANAEKSGALLSKPSVSLFMNTVEFSPALEAPTASGAPARVFELRKYNTGPERLQTTVDEFQQGLGAILIDVGMKPIIYWTADDRSSFVYLIAHKDRETARASWAAFGPKFRPFMAEFNARQSPAPTSTPADPATPAPVRRRTPDDNRFLVPTRLSPLR